MPPLCTCGCLQPLFPDDRLRMNGCLCNHTAASKMVKRPSYEVIDMGYSTPCWVWQGCLNKWGYAKIGRANRTRGGHRLFYEAYVSELPPSRAGSDSLDHLCRIRECVRPDHLVPTTCTENIHRGKVTKLNLTRVSEIRFRALLGEDQKTLAREFGIRQSQVSRIKTGLRWPYASIKAS